MDTDTDGEPPFLCLDLFPDYADQIARASERFLRCLGAAKKNRHDGVSDEFVDVAAGRNDRIGLKSKEAI